MINLILLAACTLPKAPDDSAADSSTSDSISLSDDSIIYSDSDSAVVEVDCFDKKEASDYPITTTTTYSTIEVTQILPSDSSSKDNIFSDSELNTRLQLLNTATQPINRQWVITKNTSVTGAYASSEIISDEEIREVANTLDSTSGSVPLLVANEISGNGELAWIDRDGNETTTDDQYAVLMAEYDSASSTVAHELGHNASRVHTDQTPLGYANNSDCDSTSDRDCSTPADPYGTDSCTVIGCQIVSCPTDEEGHMYSPDLTQFMSHYYGCRTSYSTEALDALNCRIGEGDLYTPNDLDVSEVEPTSALEIYNNISVGDSKGTSGSDKNYDTIQEAIDHIGFDGNIVVYEGEYQENLKVSGQHFTLQAAEGAEVTINGNGKTGLEILNEANVFIEGITFTNADYGLYAFMSTLDIENCTFTNNNFGLLVTYSIATVNDSSFSENTDSGAGFSYNQVTASNLSFENNGYGLETTNCVGSIEDVTLSENRIGASLYDGYNKTTFSDFTFTLNEISLVPNNATMDNFVISNSTHTLYAINATNGVNTFNGGSISGNDNGSIGAVSMLYGHEGAVTTFNAVDWDLYEKNEPCDVKLPDLCYDDLSNSSSYECVYHDDGSGTCSEI